MCYVAIFPKHSLQEGRTLKSPGAPEIEEGEKFRKFHDHAQGHKNVSNGGKEAAQ